jgi:hypothetical protein
VLHWNNKAVKSAYVVWLAVVGVGLVGMRTVGNPFSGSQAQYRVEYRGTVGTTLWGNYTITEHSKLRNSITEKAIGQLPLTIDFTGSRNAMVTANGSTSTQEPVRIVIYKNGMVCGNAQGIDRAGVSDTIVCR